MYGSHYLLMELDCMQMVLELDILIGMNIDFIIYFIHYYKYNIYKKIKYIFYYSLFDYAKKSQTILSLSPSHNRIPSREKITWNLL